MIFDINDNGEGVWCEYNEDVSTKIRPITKGLMRKLRKKATTKKGFRGEGNVDEAALDKLIFRHAIEDWKGFTTPSGEKIECTPEMIDAVTSKLINYPAWVIEEAMTLSENIEEGLVSEIKN